jgi:hypothetical protein
MDTLTMVPETPVNQVLVSKIVKNHIGLICKVAKASSSDNFSLYFGGQDFYFKKATYFADKEGYLSPASEGYNNCINNNDNHSIKVISGQEGRMFFIILRDDEIVTVLDPAYKQVLFAKEIKENVEPIQEEHLFNTSSRKVYEKPLEKTSTWGAWPVLNFRIGGTGDEPW